MSLRSTEGEMRLAMAELIRSDEALDEEDRRSVKLVTGYETDDEIHWQGCSCEYTNYRVAIHYHTWDDRWETYHWQGDLNELIDRLASLVEDYGSYDPYA